MSKHAEDDYLVERFTLDKKDTKKYVDVIQASYLTNDPEQGGTISFTEQTFNIFFCSPSIPKDLFVRALYKPTGTVVGFVGGNPRPIYVNGKIYKTGVPGTLAVHPDHRRKNLALRMSLEMLKAGKELGFDGGFAIFEPEAHGIDTSVSMLREVEMHSREAIRIKKFIIRVFDVKKMSEVVKTKWYEKIALRLFQGVPRVESARIRKFKRSDAERMFELLEDHRTHNQVSFMREKEDFVWFLDQPGVNCVVHEDTEGEPDGFMIAWEFIIAGFGKYHPFGWLDMVHIYRLNTSDAVNLSNYLAQTSKDRGWIGIQSPYIPYFNPVPLKRARFIFYPKELIVQFYSFNDNIPLPDKIDTFYFDWR